MSDTSFDEQDRTVGYGRRTYHAACAPGVDVTEAQLHAMRRLAVALGLTSNGGKRARPDKLCALLTDYYASAPGEALSKLPSEMRSLVMAMLDDRSVRRFAMTSVHNALDAAATGELRRARRESMRALVTPLAFWLIATGVLEADVKDDHLDYCFNALVTRSVRPHARVSIRNDRAPARGNDTNLTYAEWRTRLDALFGDGASADLTRSVRVRVIELNLDNYCLHVNDLVGVELAHPLLMVAVLHALLEAGEIINVDYRLTELADYMFADVALPAVALARPQEQVAELFRQGFVSDVHRDRLRVMGHLAGLLASGKANVSDLESVRDITRDWWIRQSQDGRRMPIPPKILLTPYVWDKVVQSVLSGPAGDILRGLGKQLDAD